MMGQAMQVNIFERKIGQIIRGTRIGEVVIFVKLIQNTREHLRPQTTIWTMLVFSNVWGFVRLDVVAGYLTLTKQHEIRDLRDSRPRSRHPGAGLISSGLGLEKCSYHIVSLGLDHQEFPSLTLGLKTETDFWEYNLRPTLFSLGLSLVLYY